jgi:adenosylcobyric acid synthase
MFAGDAFRAAFLQGLGIAAPLRDDGAEIEAVLDRLAAHVEAHLDLDALIVLAR